MDTTKVDISSEVPLGRGKAKSISMREMDLLELFFAVTVNPLSQSSSSKNFLPSSKAPRSFLNPIISTGSVRHDTLLINRSCVCEFAIPGRSINNASSLRDTWLTLTNDIGFSFSEVEANLLSSAAGTCWGGNVE